MVFVFGVRIISFCLIFFRGRRYSKEGESAVSEAGSIKVKLDLTKLFAFNHVEVIMVMTYGFLLNCSF